MSTECSRCGTTKDVHLRTWCVECGPTHTCNQCDQWHREEVGRGPLVTRLSVSRAVVETLQPHPCPRCEGQGCDINFCRDCDPKYRDPCPRHRTRTVRCKVCCPDCSQGELPPSSEWLVVKPTRHETRDDLGRRVVSYEDGPPSVTVGERIELWVPCERCGGTGCDHPLERCREGCKVKCCADCSDGQVLAGSVQVDEVYPIRLDMYFHADPGAIVVMSKAMTDAGTIRWAARPGAISTDVTAEFAAYGDPVSLIGQWALRVSDWRAA